MQRVELARLGRLAVHDGQIALLHAPGLEFRLEAAQRRLRLGDHQAAGGFLVEPVNDPRTQLSSDAGEPADLMEQAVHHGA